MRASEFVSHYSFFCHLVCGTVLFLLLRHLKLFKKYLMAFMENGLKFSKNSSTVECQASTILNTQ